VKETMGRLLKEPWNHGLIEVEHFVTREANTGCSNRQEEDSAMGYQNDQKNLDFQDQASVEHEKTGEHHLMLKAMDIHESLHDNKNRENFMVSLQFPNIHPREHEYPQAIHMEQEARSWFSKELHELDMFTLKCHHYLDASESVHIWYVPLQCDVPLFCDGLLF
jgi:hypothetical protein